jgi:hypothetical protein
MKQHRKPLIREWSPTSLESLFRCPRSWYLKKLLKIKLITPALAKGLIVHGMIEDLRLHHLRGKEYGTRKRWKSAKAFGSAAANKWHGFKKNGEAYGPIMSGKIRGDTILWDKDENGKVDDGQKWMIKNQIKSRCTELYDILMSEEQPILFPRRNARITDKEHKKYRTAFSFRFTIDGRTFRGEIDEVRPGKVLRDYKTGIWRFIEKKASFALQPTFYLLTFCSLCNKIPEFREKMGVSKVEAEHWAGNPEYITEDIGFEYFMFDKCYQWDKKLGKSIEVERSPIIKTTRSDFNYKELCQMVDTANDMLRTFEDQGFYPADREKCWDCSRFKELESACNEMTNKFPLYRRQITKDDYSKCHPATFRSDSEFARQLEFDFDGTYEVKR